MQSVSSFISKFTKTTCHIQIKFITDYYLQWQKNITTLTWDTNTYKYKQPYLHIQKLLEMSSSL